MVELVDTHDLPAGRQAQNPMEPIANMYVTYAIKSQTKKYLYVGLTNNLTRRLKEHNQGQNKTTRPYRPFKLVLQETYQSRIEARKREKQLKSGYGREYLKKL
ncbi:MAG: GIY-YIG nuclease family protein [Patescibacteria group bacterium]